MSKAALINFGLSLVAVLGGNAVYFLLMPHLPMPARHVLFKVDLGLVVDFWFCLVLFGILKTIAGWRSRSRG